MNEIDKTKTKAELIVELERLRGLLGSWEPTRVSDALRAELQKVRAQNDDKKLAAINTAVDILKLVVEENKRNLSDLSKELRKHREFLARRESGVVGLVKRAARHIGKRIDVVENTGSW